MSKNPNRLHIFTKGNKYLGGYIITSGTGEKVGECTLNETQEESPFYSEFEAIISSLKYVIENKENNIPKTPSVFIFTNEENKFDVDSGKKGANKEKFEEMMAIKEKITGDVKILHIPKSFDNKMDYLIEKMEDEKKEKNKPKKGGLKK